MSSEMKFEAADLEGLSPEERAALEEVVEGGATEAHVRPQEQPQEQEQPQGAQAQEDAPAPEVKEEAPQAKAPEDENTGEAAAGDASAQATEQEAKEETPAQTAGMPVQQPASPYAYALPAEFGERAKALQEREAELADKLAAGDIDATQFIMQQRELAREQAKLDAMQFKAEMAAEMQQQAVNRAQQAESDAWGQAMHELAGTLGDGAPDYLNNEVDGMALAHQARAIIVARGMTEGAPVADKMAVLRQAHQMVLLMRGQAAPQNEAPAPQPEEAKGKAMAARKVDLSAAPASLGTVQGADSGSTDAFSRLDELDGEQLEDELAKMARTNPAAYERWLAAA